MLTLFSPGGGGWGMPSDEVASNDTKPNNNTSAFQPRGSVHAFGQAAEAAM
jgi:5-oxoprolinase (ATP-hydrolysing)